MDVECQILREKVGDRNDSVSINGTTSFDLERNRGRYIRNRTGKLYKKKLV